MRTDDILTVDLRLFVSASNRQDDAYVILTATAKLVHYMYPIRPESCQPLLSTKMATKDSWSG